MLFWMRPRRLSAFPSLLPFALRIPNTCADGLGNQAALKLGDSSENRENHFPRGRGGIELLRGV